MKAFCTVFVLVLTLAVQAQDLKKTEFSVSLGYLFEGEIYLAEFDQYSSFGESILLRIQFDNYFASMGSRFGIGAYYNYASPYMGAIDDSFAMHEFGVAFKARLSASESLLIKPMLNVGYRTYDDDESSTGLGINGAVDLQFFAGKLKPFVELGILSQPSGGNDLTDATFAPIFQISAGLTF
ncbi:MAG: hypothetical protein L0Y35_01035 [Flammeovirgaceae bacterium]|nr:hypothetical protein [Flammeovirgaceae bacterium]